MKYKSILLFALLAATIASLNFVSCHKYEPVNDDYSDWAELTEADSVIFAKARAAYLDDPENFTKPEYVTMESVSTPSSVRSKAVENGRNYQFSLTMFVVTIYKGYDNEVGKVIEIEEQAPPSRPMKRDTILW